MTNEYPYWISNLEAVVRQYHALITKGLSPLDAKRWIKNNWSGSGYLDNDDLQLIEAQYNERYANRYNEHYKGGIYQQLAS